MPVSATLPLLLVALSAPSPAVEARAAVADGRWAAAAKAAAAWIAAQPDSAAAWALRGEIALAQGDTVGAVEATQRSVRLDPQQPSVHRRLRVLDPDLAEPLPVWRALPVDRPSPPAWTTAAVEAQAWSGGVRLRADGRRTEWYQALLVARDPARAAPLTVPGGADVHRLRRWPAAGGPPVPLTPADARRWAEAVGDRLEIAWLVDQPAQAEDGAVLRLAAPWPGRDGQYTVSLARGAGWWLRGLRLPEPVPTTGRGQTRFAVPECPARGAGPDDADWLMDEPAIVVGRAVDGPAFASAGYQAPVDPPAVLAAATLRGQPVPARIAALRNRHAQPEALAAALRAAGVEAWPVAVRPRWQRPSDALPRSGALLPVRAVWLPGEGRVIPPPGVALGDLGGADGVVLDGSGRWIRLPAAQRTTHREGAVEQRGPAVVVVRGVDDTSWPGATPLDEDTRQTALRRWASPAPHRPWRRWGRAAPGRTRWLGAPQTARVVYDTDRPPAAASIRGPGGSRWERTVRPRPAGARVTSELSLPGGPVSPERWAAFLDFCAAVERTERGHP